MNRLKKPFKEWFGYNRRERRATITLLIIATLLLSVRHIVAEQNEIPVLSALVSEPEPVRRDSILSGEVEQKVVKKQEVRQPIRVELNSCDSATLVKLPGIGPVFSARIIKFRNLLGGYADKSQLLEVYGLPPETFERISSMVTADTALIEKLQINRADYRTLVRHPYLTPAEVSAILRYREAIGFIDDMATLRKNNLITGEKVELLRYYISFD
jgi:DNA uptake protein ComE-like DNA-binding protein